ncbi:hypothetical protein [Macrococcus capreoli]|uniref:hypothetical protein n=1 Tax=Macrococcus capreoli TaxID=2982690 RepID=UPI003EE7C39E
MSDPQRTRSEKEKKNCINMRINFGELKINLKLNFCDMRKNDIISRKFISSIVIFEHQKFFSFFYYFDLTQCHNKGYLVNTNIRKDNNKNSGKDYELILNYNPNELSGYQIFNLYEDYLKKIK